MKANFVVVQDNFMGIGSLQTEVYDLDYSQTSLVRGYLIRMPHNPTHFLVTSSIIFY